VIFFAVSSARMRVSNMHRVASTSLREVIQKPELD